MSEWLPSQEWATNTLGFAKATFCGDKHAWDLGREDERNPYRDAIRCHWCGKWKDDLITAVYRAVHPEEVSK